MSKMIKGILTLQIVLFPLLVSGLVNKAADKAEGSFILLKLHVTHIKFKMIRVEFILTLSFTSRRKNL